MAVSWVMTDEEMSVETELALGFLDFLMMGTNASPLMKVCACENCPCAPCIPCMRLCM